MAWDPETARLIGKIKAASTQKMVLAAGKTMAKHCDLRIARFRKLLQRFLDMADDGEIPFHRPLNEFAKDARKLMEDDLKGFPPKKARRKKKASFVAPAM